MLKKVKEWWEESPPQSTHSNFKIIINGKELPYPFIRLLTSWVLAFLLGIAVML